MWSRSRSRLGGNEWGGGHSLGSVAGGLAWTAGDYGNGGRHLQTSGENPPSDSGDGPGLRKAKWDRGRPALQPPTA